MPEQPIPHPPVNFNMLRNLFHRGADERSAPHTLNADPSTSSGTSTAMTAPVETMQQTPGLYRQGRTGTINKNEADQFKLMDPGP